MRIYIKESLPTPMIQGEKVWLREMEKRDLETFAGNPNDLEIGYIAGCFFPQNMTALEKWYAGLMGDQHGKDGFYFTICPIGSDDPIGFA